MPHHTPYLPASRPEDLVSRHPASTSAAAAERLKNLRDASGGLIHVEILTKLQN